MNGNPAVSTNISGLNLSIVSNPSTIDPSICPSNVNLGQVALSAK